MLDAILGRARVHDLGRPLVRGMPQSPNHPPFQMILERRHGDRERSDGTSSANEIIIMGGHVGTHVDALCHFSHAGRMYGGADAGDAQRGGRFRQHGVEQLPITFGRGLLLDVVSHLGDHVTVPGYEISVSDLEISAAAAGLEICPGDVVLVRTGWGNLWDERNSFPSVDEGMPGPGVAAIEWLCARGVSLVGSDTIAFERIAPNKGLAELPGHRLLLVEHGIPIVESLDLEMLAADRPGPFLFVMAPLKLVGATASPVRPLAVLLD